MLCDCLDGERWRFLLKILCVDALLIALKSLLESFGLTLYFGDTTDLFFRAAPSFLGNPNFSSMFMACLMPLVLVFWRQSKAFAARAFYALAGFFMLSSLAILASRGALLGLLGGAAVGFILLIGKYRRRFKPLPTVAAVALVTAVLAIVQIGRPDSFYLNFNDNNIDFRLEVWQKSLQAIIQHPLVGVGLGNFALFYEHLPRPAAIGVFDDPHNLWIFLAVTGGLPLLVLFFGLVVLAAGRGLRRFRADRDPLLLGVLCALTVFVISAAFTPVSIPLYLLLGVLLGGILSESSVPKQSVKLPLAFLVPAAACGVFFIVWGVCLFLGQTTLYFGRSAYSAGNYGLADSLLTVSARLDPGNSSPRFYLIETQTRLRVAPAKVAGQIGALKRLHPDQADTQVLAANAYFDLYGFTQDSRYLDGGIAAMTGALKIDPTSADRYGELGFYYLVKKDYGQALHYLDSSLVLKPDLLPSLLLEAKIYQEQNDRGNFLATLERAYKTNVSDPKLKYLWFLAKRGQNIRDVPLTLIYPKL